MAAIECGEQFKEFAHSFVHELMDKNKAFQDRYGMHARWDWEPEDCTITFTDPEKPTLRIDCTVVGTTEGKSWEWTWANPNFESHSKRGMDEVRAFGEAEGYKEMTTAFVLSDEYTGWMMTAVAAHILNAPGAYRFPTEGGHHYLIYREIHEIEREQWVHSRFRRQSRPL